MIHHERALAAQLVPERECRTDRAACIAGRRLNVDAPKRRYSPHLAVGDRVHRAAARKRQIRRTVSRLQPFGADERTPPHTSPALSGRCRDAGPQADRLACGVAREVPRAPARTGRRTPARRHPTDTRSARSMVAKILEVELEGAVGQERHDLAHGIEVRRLAIRRKPHHLVFVAIMGKAEILRQRLVEDAERMRKIHAAVLPRDRSPLPDAPSRTGEIAEAVDRNDHGLLERRHVKGRGQMREVMLDSVERSAEALAWKALASRSGIPARLRRLRKRARTSPGSGRWLSK